MVSVAHSAILNPALSIRNNEISMRSMSFMLTTDQVRNQTRTVTHRTGWAELKPWTLLRAVVKERSIDIRRPLLL